LIGPALYIPPARLPPFRRNQVLAELLRVAPRAIQGNAALLRVHSGRYGLVNFAGYLALALAGAPVLFLVAAAKVAPAGDKLVPAPLKVREQRKIIPRGGRGFRFAQR
jgi:hypothetical protein